MTKDEQLELGAWLHRFATQNSGGSFDSYACGALLGTALQFPEMTFFEVVAKMRELSGEEAKKVQRRKTGQTNSPRSSG